MMKAGREYSRTSSSSVWVCSGTTGNRVGRQLATLRSAPTLDAQLERTSKDSDQDSPTRNEDGSEHEVHGELVPEDHAREERVVQEAHGAEWAEHNDW